MRTLLSPAIAALALLPATSPAADPVPRFGVFEEALEADRDYDNPFWDVDATVTFASPSGKRTTVDAFWDGGRTWRVRFSPDEAGSWSWRSASSVGDVGLEGKTGAFECLPDEGDNELLRRGPLRLADDRRSIAFADGSPFFWLGDTAWNGVLRAHPEHWDRYLRTRADQRFTVIQFVTTQWRGGRAVLDDLAFEGEQRIRIHPSFYQKRDPMIAAINDHGMVAAPILLWALTESDPGRALPIADAVRLARYEVARYGAYQVVWLLGGDGHYLRPDEVERWKAIGRGVFGDDGGNDRGRLASLHPSGQAWVGDVYASEPWYDLIGYQSGHGDNADHLRWLVQGPPARPWTEQPELPIINMEPNYETHPSYHSDTVFGAFEVRRASYWSLLVSPPAGVTFGHNAIWVWNDRPGLAEGHEGIGTVAPWTEGLDTPGVRSMTVLRDFFESGPWPSLRPDPSLLRSQPGSDDPSRFVAAASTPDGSWAVFYSPRGGTISLDSSKFDRPMAARWFDPRSGAFREAGPVGKGPVSFEAPSDEDWVLDLRPADA
ncbi:apiosidase-like domain-containing protein [Tautonia sociabilis]|uniref:DUF4038 domain-containing protein n=1 Tax=Tautonia sociabilis TaxID=2080755 RepID=A0A432MMK7_9BACT|nr:DUF4038 domain-containing protein [Tautonia sociabilis]RUL88652.1 DUF4038 domain-containing protein [Tautonia sociabilis]